MIGLSIVDRIIEHREDVIYFEPSRCLRSRFRKSSCTICMDNCINSAIAIDTGRVSRDESKCSQCMLCVSGCPSGAFIYDRNWYRQLLGRLKHSQPDLIACDKSMPVDNPLKIPCIGLLSESILIALAVMSDSTVFIDISLCHGCENSHVLASFRKRVSNVADMLSLDMDEKLYLVNSRKLAESKHRAVGRRGFLGDLKGLISRSIKRETVSQNHKEPMLFSQKQQTIDSEVLAYALSGADKKLQLKILHNYYYTVNRNEKCRSCAGCSAMCPTGALKLKKKDGAKQHSFEILKCNGCRLCQAFCKRQALVISPYTGDISDIINQLEYQSRESREW